MTGSWTGVGCEDAVEIIYHAEVGNWVSSAVGGTGQCPFFSRE